MATLTDLRPNGDITTLDVLKVDDAGSTYYEATDDDPNSPNSNDYVYAYVDATLVLDLTNVDADLDSMDSCGLRFYISSSGTRDDDSVLLYAKVANAANSEDFITEFEVSKWDAGGVSVSGLTTGGSITGDGEAASKAEWDAARLHLRWDYQQTKGSDSLQIRVDAVELYGTYSVASANVEVEVPLGTLTLTGYAPTVVASDHQTVAVPLATLTLTGYAPTVTVSDNITVAVPLGTLTLTGYAPTVAVTQNVNVAVPAATLTLTGYAPTVAVTQSANIEVPLGTLTLTGYAPTVTVSNNITVAVPLGTLTLTGYAPTVSISNNITVAVPAATLTLTGYAPTVAASQNVSVSVPVASLALTGYAPTITITTVEPAAEERVGGPGKLGQYWKWHLEKDWRSEKLAEADRYLNREMALVNQRREAMEQKKANRMQESIEDARVAQAAREFDARVKHEEQEYSDLYKQRKEKIPIRRNAMMNLERANIEREKRREEKDRIYQQRVENLAKARAVKKRKRKKKK